MRIRKWMWIGLGAVVLVIAANRIEYACRSRAAAIAAAPQFSVVVKQEEGTVGHRTIGVAEGMLPDQVEASVLRFSTLAAWDYDASKNPPCPSEIAALAGANVTMVGFMYPLEAGSQVKTFCLLRSTQTCCYGPRPQYSQYLLVEMREAVRFERLAPVIVEGKFLAEAHPADGYIYHLDGTSVRAADGEQTEIDAVAAARAAGLKLLDFAWLESLRPESDGSQAAPSPRLAELDGCQVVIEGFCVGQTKGNPPGVFVGKEWWDGVAKGTPPDLFNAIKVFLAGDNEFPSRWQDRAVFTGTLRLTADSKDWPARGVVSIEGAVKGVPGQGPKPTASGQAGPYLPLPIEIILLGGCVAMLPPMHASRSRSCPCRVGPAAAPARARRGRTS
ncbi:MAG: DUF3299 domain-containing protein [Planctomycetota bacterium]|nr:DUF3299 domain-containing protein [Planctomycetota bacterium]